MTKALQHHDSYECARSVRALITDFQDVDSWPDGYSSTQELGSAASK